MASSKISHELEYFLVGFYLYTDHSDLIFIFDPTTTIPKIGHVSLRKVHLWPDLMWVCNFVCIHIRGVDNLWAEFITLWSTPRTTLHLISIPPLPITLSKFVCPFRATMPTSQDAHSSSLPASAVLCDSNWIVSYLGPVWMMTETIIIYDCLPSPIGHRRHPRTNTHRTYVNYGVYWTKREIFIRLFVAS